MNQNQKTLQNVLDNFLNFPKYIYKRNGKISVRDSSKMIERGDVSVNDVKILNPEYKLSGGEYIRWGCTRASYGPKCCLRVP